MSTTDTVTADFTAQRLPARVVRFGKIKPSQYPPYEPVQSVLFTCQTDQGERELWKTFPAREAQLLTVDQQVNVYNRSGIGDRPIWEVEFTTTHKPVQTPQVIPRNLGGSPQAPAPSPAALSANAEVAMWVETQAELYAQCFDAAKRTLAAREVSEETVRAAASTLFISASRKFKLER